MREFFRLPCPGLALKWRAIVATLGAVGLVVCVLWLQGLGWPDTQGASSGLLLLPLVLLAVSLGVGGAIVGGLVATTILFQLGGGLLSSSGLWLRSANFTAVALVVAAFAHLQGYYQRRLFHAMTHDPGTGLPGRLALWRALDRQLAGREPGVPKNGLVVITLDNLQDITTTFGYEAADVLIAQLWQRLVDVFYPGARAYHYHRERLAVLFHDPDDDLDVLMGKLVERFETSVLYEGVPIHFTSLFGFVRLNGRDGRNVITQAEAAIETAREQGIRSVIYTAGMERDRKRGLILLGDLQTAKRDGSLTLHYQPKIRLATMTLDSFEALARWEHPSLGTVSPAEFIPIVEHTDCIHSFSLWVTNQALIAAREHWGQADKAIPIAVNISSRNLTDHAFPAQIRALLAKHKLSPQSLELEVTESEIMKNPKQAVAVLEKLSDIPVVISIDDFGTGYSSLAYLHRLPATTIKIDRGFIDKINGDVGVREIVAAAIDLAHALGMQVIAEGIETADQLETLHQLGCDLGQGFFFSPAMPIEKAAAWQPEAAVTL
ncbi:EAL domain, c-di-GMP-specific phosphodiesterase class I (or its enzymatically inactive variant) [Ectothiorhodospira magna]|uniref:EAL domain, c-di-GMP-specific phosphodiesterase class I (Or its enzymatically inactive variant) n=1 Tax=Ectothiorhodospira magna TaxID=867345 RepID=A0A1H9FPU4_9GAMM|nr:GGDEF domain-containing phosphodiesterase [Ectothiorhodospira magna]SEQ39388.1 EAL domain, c-di-GMP-specific phosphodiesterase class I (or its enzymatically inactive variant) [Ectothiorhodospira magna]